MQIPDFEIECNIDYPGDGYHKDYEINIKFKNFLFFSAKLYEGSITLAIERDGNRELPFSSDYKCYYYFSSLYYSEISNNKINYMGQSTSSERIIFDAIIKMFENLVSKNIIFQTFLEKYTEVLSNEIHKKQLALEKEFNELERVRGFLG